MAKIGIALFVLLLGAGCATVKPDAAYRENSVYDAGAGTHLASMHLNVLAPQEEEPGLLAFDAFRLEGPSGVEWTVDLTYMARDWLFIQEGASLAVSIDGRIVHYGTGKIDPKTERAVLADDSIVEQAIYPISLADLRAIAAAKVVIVTVTGSHGTASGRFSQANFDRLRGFLQRNAGTEP
jgi:hypothetical protein